MNIDGNQQKAKEKSRCELMLVEIVVIYMHELLTKNAILLTIYQASVTS